MCETQLEPLKWARARGATENRGLEACSINQCYGAAHPTFECSHGGGNPAPLHKNTAESKCHPAHPESREKRRRERADASLRSPGCDVAAGNEPAEPRQDLLTRQRQATNKPQRKLHLQ